MADLILLLQRGLIVTALDIDNALYMTSVIDGLPPRMRRQVIVLGIAFEFFGRIGLILLFAYIFSGTEPLFTVFGIEITPESIALIAAGVFLLVRNVSELHEFYRGGDLEEPSEPYASERRSTTVLVRMTSVNVLLSVDTVIAIGVMTSSASQVLYLLLFSAVVRLFFVEQVAGLTRRYPVLNPILNSVLIFIGVHLILEGLGLGLPEALVNVTLLAILGVVVVVVRRRR